MSAPRFSVVIPLHEKALHIDRALESVLGQRCASFEVLVVDDGSTDGGPEKVAARNDARVRLLRQANAGVAAARNAGIAAARGEYIAFLDADDVWHPDFLAEIERVIRRFPHAGLYCTGYVFRSAGRDRPPQLGALAGRAAPGPIDYFDAVATGDMVATASSVCVPQAVLARLGGFPAGERIGEDQDLWARIALEHPVVLSPRPLAVYHLDAANMATRLAPEQQPWPFVQRLLQRLESGGIPAAQARRIEHYAARQLIGQASQLVLAGERKAARRLLAQRVTSRQRLRRGIWWLVSLLPHAAVVPLYALYAGLGRVARQALTASKGHRMESRT